MSIIKIILLIVRSKMEMQSTVPNIVRQYTVNKLLETKLQDQAK
jgi:hypothetical protein